MRSIFPHDVAVAALDIVGNAIPPIFQEEEMAIARAVPARQREFATGRHAARQALRQFGIGPVAIPVEPGRAPIWPDAVTGSITHSGGLCAACVGWRHHYRGLGIDCETIGKFDARLRRLVAQNQDGEFDETLPGVPDDLRTILVFSMKESGFKAYHSLVPQLLGFDDLHIRATESPRRFLIETCGQARIAVTIPCCVTWDAERVYTGAWIPAVPANPYSLPSGSYSNIVPAP